MMYPRKDALLVPRNGHTLVVGIVARISGCQHQKELSLEDQVDHAKQEVAELYSGPIEYRVFATKGKGERLDRPELAEVEAALRTRELDLLFAEDLGRMVRGWLAVWLFGLAKDHGTRGISPNDGVDTNDPDWEQRALEACADHVAHNAHTSKRLKQKLMARFVRDGQAFALKVAGYVVPEGAKNYSEWQKDECATPIIREGLRILAETRNCCAVANYFNSVSWGDGIGFSPGPYCRKQAWDGKMIRRYYRNPLLGGRPGRGFRHTVKHYETGRRISVPNPNGPQFREFPHLAHVDFDELERVNEELNKANKNLGRKYINGADPRAGVAKKRTRFPGQWGRCWYCGHHHVWGGNGMTANLMCSASREWACWNSFGYSGPLALEKVVSAMTGFLYELDGLDEQFRSLVESAGQDSSGELARRRAKLQKDEAAHATQTQNVQKVMKEMGDDRIVLQTLKELQETGRALARERKELEWLSTSKLQLPKSVGELRTLFEEAFRKLGTDSPEFGDLLRKLVPEFHVYLVRLCDGGHLLPRARVKLTLDGIVPDARHVDGMPQLLTKVLTLDLFMPPQRERIREAAVVQPAQGMTHGQIAARIRKCLSDEKITGTAVGNALALDGKMKELGLSSPYVLVTEPPADYTKARRSKNSKYRFEPLDGYVPPQL